MTTAIEYALMAGASYLSNRDPKNQFPIPADWHLYSTWPADSVTGFEASTFQNGAEIVISYAGTDFSTLSGSGDWLHGNIPLAMGIVSDQLKQAADYYLTVKALNTDPNTHITLTGHSLGGGIAALIGVFFGETTFTFDQAPFAETAKLGAQALMNYLTSEGKYTDTQLSGLTNYIQQQQASTTLITPIPNEGLVTNLNTQEELKGSASHYIWSNHATSPTH